MNNFIKPGPNKRVCSYLIDSLALSFIPMAFSITDPFKQWVIVSIPFLVRDAFNGQSLGKMIVGLKVIDSQNNPAQVIQSIQRNFLLIIPILPLVEYVVMLRNPDGKRLGDNIAATVVTDLKPELKDGLFLWISIALFIGFICIAAQTGQIPQPPAQY